MMKTKTTLIGILLLLSVATFVWRQYGPPEKPHRAPDIKLIWNSYGPSTAETIQGKIINLEYVKNLKGLSFGLRMLLQTDEKKLSVILGPKAYVTKQAITLNKGDKLEVVCSSVVVENQTVILAAEIHKGNQTLKLRDRNGFPLWTGSSQRSKQEQ
jgi:hypothetical protein